MPIFVRWFLLPLAMFFGVVSPMQSQQQPIKTSICEAVGHASRFDGKKVRVHATYSGTFEGTWLSDSQCDYAGELVLPIDHQVQQRYGVEAVVTRLSKMYGIEDVIRDKDWDQFDFSRRHLYTGMTPPIAGCVVDVEADFDGILIIKRNFRFKNGFGNGWGHLGGSRFLLVLGSVSNVASHPCAGAPTDSPPVVKFPTGNQPPDLLTPSKTPD
jgi:hypothetical protein